MVLEVTKQKVIMITTRIVWVLDVMNVAYELSVPSAKVWVSRADKDNNNSPENLRRKVFLDKSFDWNLLYNYRKLFNLAFLIKSLLTRQHFDPLRRSRRFKFSAVLVLTMTDLLIEVKIVIPKIRLLPSVLTFTLKFSVTLMKKIISFFFVDVFFYEKLTKEKS